MEHVTIVNYNSIIVSSICISWEIMTVVSPYTCLLHDLFLYSVIVSTVTSSYETVATHRRV